MSKLELQNYELKRKLKESEQKNKDFKIQLDNFKNENKELKQENTYVKNDCIKQIDKIKSELKTVCNVLATTNNDVVDLQSKKKELEKALKILTKKTQKLEQVVIDLKSNKLKDSTNSGKPSSTNGFKKVIQNNREKSDKPKGGQLGRKGVTIEQVENPDKIVDIFDLEKCMCGGNILYSTEYLKKQIKDLLVSVETIEYRYYKGICELCNKEYMAEIPQEHHNPISYSKNIRTLVSAIRNVGSVSNHTTKELFRIITRNKLNLSVGMIHKNDMHIANKSNKVIENLTEILKKSPLNYADETGVKVAEKLGCCISCSNNDTVLYQIFLDKSKKSFDEFGVFQYFKNTLIHDHNKTYYMYEAIIHGECNVHICRYLKYIIDIFQRKGAKELREFLTSIYREKLDEITKGNDKFSVKKLIQIKNKYLKIISNWKKEFEEKTLNMNKLPKTYNEEKCLFKRLEKYVDQHLLFVNDFKVPFSNNEAERNLRSIKIKMNVSKRFDKIECAKAYAKIKSIIETAKKRNMDILQIYDDILNSNSENVFKMQETN